MLAAVIGTSGLLSALFVNDTICLVMPPLILEICRAARLRPLPFLLAVAMAANVGSVATLTGNPQNMMIGTFSGIGYRDFMGTMAPIAWVGLVLCFVLLAWVYRSDLEGERRIEIPPVVVRVYRPLFWKSMVATGGMLIEFFAGPPVSSVALFAATFRRGCWWRWRRRWRAT